MLYSFLKSAKPIHYLLTGIFLVVGMLLLTALRDFKFLESGLALVGGLLSFVVFQFLVAKNELIGRSAMGLWVLLWLFLALVAVRINLESVCAMLLLLLAFRRICAMRTGKEEISKIFDASFWLSICCFINPWYAILFLVIYTGIFLYSRNQLRFWFIPFIAMSCVGFLSFTISYVFDLPIYRPWENSWELTNVSLVHTTTKAFLFYSLLGLVIIFLVTYILRIIDVNKRVPKAISVLIISMIIAALLMVINHTLPFNAGILLLPPLAIFLGRAAYFLKNKKFREVILWLPVLLCVVNWILFLLV